jgi:cation transport regulator ChaB
MLGMKNYPTPYLVKHGVLFNALLKEAIINKQADVIQQIIPYLLLMKAGTDKLAELGMLADESDMKALKDQIIKAKSEADQTGELGKLLATLNYDVNLEHFIPDLGKILDEKILRSTDKNILAGLGLIELQGFSKTREESIMNPKLLIEEVKDGVSDWVAMVKEVVAQIKERNKEKHADLAAKDVDVLSGRIKTFMTDAMRDALRSLADRGVISYKTEIEDIAELSYETEKSQIEKEDKEGLRKLFVPKPSQVVNPSTPAATPSDNTPPDKKPGTPESKNYKNARYENIDALPGGLKEAFPIAAQLIFLKAFNEKIDEGKLRIEAHQSALDVVAEKYKQIPGKEKWVKKD